MTDRISEPLIGSVSSVAVASNAGLALLFAAAFGLFRSFARGRHADDVIALLEIHAAHASRPWRPHRANVIFVEADRLPIMRSEEDDLVAVGQRGCDQFVALLDADGDNPALTSHAKNLSARSSSPCHCAWRRKYIGLLLPDSRTASMVRTVSPGLQADEIADVLALAGRAHIGNLIHLEPVHASGIGEDQNVSMSRGNEQMLDEILVARLHAGTPGASAALHAISRNRRPLHVARMAHRDRNLLVGDQVFEHDLRRFVFDHRTPRIAVKLLHLFEFFDDDVAQLLLRRENRLRIRRCSRAPTSTRSKFHRSKAWSGGAIAVRGSRPPASR